MKNIFIVSPYSIDFLYNEKKKIMESISRKYGLGLIRAENSSTGESLSAEETAILLQKCDCAIADLSYERPSCYYEVGYLQGIQKRVYMICDSNTSLHQLLDSKNVLSYSSLDDYELLIERVLRNIVDVCMRSAKEEITLSL